MKIVFTLACGAVMICNLAQSQDTTLAKIDKMESAIRNKATTEMATPVSVVEEVPAEKKIQSTFKLPDYSGKHSILNNKVGPNGEELFMKKNKFFYINGAGKKIKARRADLADRPKTS